MIINKVLYSILLEVILLLSETIGKFLYITSTLTFPSNI